MLASHPGRVSLQGWQIKQQVRSAGLQLVGMEDHTFNIGDIFTVAIKGKFEVQLLTEKAEDSKSL